MIRQLAVDTCVCLALQNDLWGCRDDVKRAFALNAVLSLAGHQRTSLTTAYRFCLELLLTLKAQLHHRAEAITAAAGTDSPEARQAQCVLDYLNGYYTWHVLADRDNTEKEQVLHHQDRAI